MTEPVDQPIWERSCDFKVAKGADHFPVSLCEPAGAESLRAWAHGRQNEGMRLVEAGTALRTGVRRAHPRGAAPACYVSETGQLT